MDKFSTHLYFKLSDYFRKIFSQCIQGNKKQYILRFFGFKSSERSQSFTPCVPDFFGKSVFTDIWMSRGWFLWIIKICVQSSRTNKKIRENHVSKLFWSAAADVINICFLLTLWNLYHFHYETGQFIPFKFNLRKCDYNNIIIRFIIWFLIRGLPTLPEKCSKLCKLHNAKHRSQNYSPGFIF